MDVIYVDPEDPRVKRPDWLPEDWYVVERHDGEFGTQFIGYIGPTCGVTPATIEGNWFVYKARNYAFESRPLKCITVQTPLAAVMAAILLDP